MAEAKRAVRTELQARVRWLTENLDQIIADELQLQWVNDRFYLTFGQIQVPFVEPEGGNFVADIRPVGRYVVSRQSLEKIRDLLNRVLDDSAGVEP